MKGNVSVISLCPLVPPAYLCCVLLVMNHTQRKRVCGAGCAPQASGWSAHFILEMTYGGCTSLADQRFSVLWCGKTEETDGFCFSL